VIFEANYLAVEILFGLVIAMLYFAPLEYATGRTVAKLYYGTKVATEDGGKPDFNTILIRTFCRFIPFEPVSFLASDGSGWHDTMSHTKVIDVKQWRSVK